MRRRGRREVFQMGAVFEMGFARECAGAFLPWRPDLTLKAFSRPSAPVSCKAASSSPADFQQFFSWGFHAAPDGLSHARNREKIKRLLDRVPVLFRNEDGARSL